MTAGFVSMTGFLVIALGAGDYGAKIQGVVTADIVAIVLLVTATVLKLRLRPAA